MGKEGVPKKMDRIVFGGSVVGSVFMANLAAREWGPNKISAAIQGLLGLAFLTIAAEEYSKNRRLRKN